MKRRGLGPAYERSPYEHLVERGSRNLLTLVGALMVAFLWILLVHYMVGTLLNFIATGGSETVEEPWDPDAPWVVTTKLLGAIVVGWLTVKLRSR